MCKSASEGGQRCASWARERLALKSVAVQEAVTDAAISGNPAGIGVAKAEWEQAAAEYASTPEGNEHLSRQAMQAASDGDFDTEAMLNTVIRRGESMRAANAETRSLLRAAALSQQDAPVLPGPADSATLRPGSPMPPMDEIGQEAQARFDAATGELATVERVKWERTDGDRQYAPHQVDKETHGYSVVGSFDDEARDMQDRLAVLARRVEDPEATDAELAAGFAKTFPYGRRMDYPRDLARQDTETLAGAERAAMALANQRALQALRGRHPGIGSKTLAVLSDPAGRSAEVVEQALLHPDTDAGTLALAVSRDADYRISDIARQTGSAANDRSRKFRNYTPTAAVVDEARRRRPTSPALAVALAFTDADSAGRADARRQIAETPIEEFHPADRDALARNVTRLPGDPIAQRQLAHDLIRWAESHGDETQRAEMGRTLAPVVAGMDGLADRAAALRGETQPAKRGWFR